MKEQADNLPVAKQSLRMIDGAALLPANVAILQKCGAMSAILKVIESHPDDKDIQEIGAGCLAKIAGPEQLTAAVKEVSDLAAGINKSPGMVKMLVDKFNRAANLLSNLALVDRNKAHLTKVGAVQALVDGLEACGKMPMGEKREVGETACAAGILRLANNAQAQG